LEHTNPKKRIWITVALFTKIGYKNFFVVQTKNFAKKSKAEPAECKRATAASENQKIFSITDCF
jgi:hypothetical protein